MNTPQDAHAEDDNATAGGNGRRIPWLPRARWLILGAVVIFALMQLVPYGRSYTNPPVKATPVWPSAKVEQLATDACADCHSNTTTWPWYARIAPGSWLIKKDVDEGRSKLNWSVPCGESDEIKRIVEGGEMPPLQYKLIHANARLSAADKKTLGTGLQKALAGMNMKECRGGG